MEVEKSERINRLFDLYGNLLTEKQQDIFISYFQYDLSLAEIAENDNVSRNAVFNNLHRVENLLEEYEEKLHLLDKYNQIIENVNPKDREKIISILNK